MISSKCKPLCSRHSFNRALKLPMTARQHPEASILAPTEFCRGAALNLCVKCEIMMIYARSKQQHAYESKGTEAPPKHFSCSQCFKRYASKTALNRHLRYDCGKEPMFKCSACPYKAHQKIHVQKHFNNIHSKIAFVTGATNCSN
ncbi:hypothetical protein ILUMI_19383 [Ignelater luminosus]|uniref:C2H2-type domain-containing protein n=1 Tax=Ignelater luminosus TaxID=2038154 RepID=A0A8K0CGD7_IGNLU|nr:hypothetical protein ILUMI_19383 [Ignelater luminosus]